MKPSQLSFRPVFLLFLALLVTGGVYWPGLFGAFLLDDHGNLGTLAALNTNASLYAWMDFIVGGRSGPAGRPMSLLTFALQHASWPGFPVDFKIVNLAIHLVNGLLLHILVVKTGRLAAWPKHRTQTLAFLAPTLWLLHPIQVSTVLYVVQRMTLLSATFVLVGMLVFLKGREMIHAEDAPPSQQTRGILLCGTGVAVGGLLAVLSKENGAVLPLLLLVTEFTLLAHLPWPKKYARLRATLLHGPWLLMCGYILVKWTAIIGQYASRTFSLPERLMTQTRVVTEYLGQIVAPKLHGLGLFHDDYVVSHGLTQPPSTLWSLLFLLLLFIIPFSIRSRAVWMAFGILWFFTGHLIESTFLPLELYFEHRNYLPLFGFAFMAAWIIDYLYHLTPRPRTRLLAGFLGTITLGQLVFISFEESRVWGTPFRQALIWAEENPNSVRARLNWGNVLYMANLIDDAEKLLDEYTLLQPDDATAQLIKLKIRCDYPDRPIPLDDAYIKDVSTKRGGNKATIIGILDFAQQIIERKKCSAIEPEVMIKILLGLLENPTYGGSVTKNSLHLLAGRMYVVVGDLSAAMHHYDLSQNYDLRMDTYLQQIKWLASAGLFDDARVYLEKANAMPGKNWLTSYFRQRELEPYYQMFATIATTTGHEKPSQ